jgi:hypothetical protein
MEKGRGINLTSASEAFHQTQASLRLPDDHRLTLARQKLGLRRLELNLAEDSVIAERSQALYFCAQ